MTPGRDDEDTAAEHAVRIITLVMADSPIPDRKRRDMGSNDGVLGGPRFPGSLRLPSRKLSDSLKKSARYL